MNILKIFFGSLKDILEKGCQKRGHFQLSKSIFNAKKKINASLKHILFVLVGTFVCQIMTTISNKIFDFN